MNLDQKTQSCCWPLYLERLSLKVIKTSIFENLIKIFWSDSNYFHSQQQPAAATSPTSCLLFGIHTPTSNFISNLNVFSTGENVGKTRQCYSLDVSKVHYYDCVVVRNNFPCVGHCVSVSLPANICLSTFPPNDRKDFFWARRRRENCSQFESCSQSSIIGKVEKVENCSAWWLLLFGI